MPYYNIDLMMISIFYPSSYYIGGSTESPPSNYYTSGSTYRESDVEQQLSIQSMHLGVF